MCAKNRESAAKSVLVSFSESKNSHTCGRNEAGKRDDSSRIIATDSPVGAFDPVSERLSGVAGAAVDSVFHGGRIVTVG